MCDIAANAKNINEAARLSLKHPLKKEKIKTASKQLPIIPNKSFQYKFTFNN